MECMPSRSSSSPTKDSFACFQVLFFPLSSSPPLSASSFAFSFPFPSQLFSLSLSLGRPWVSCPFDSFLLYLPDFNFPSTISPFTTIVACSPAMTFFWVQMSVPCTYPRTIYQHKHKDVRGPFFPKTKQKALRLHDPYSESCCLFHHGAELVLITSQCSQRRLTTKQGSQEAL